MKQVFFMGAGFSKAVDSRYPILNSLTQAVEEELKTCDKNLFQYYQEEIPNTIKQNIENLLSYLFVNYPWIDSKKKYLNKALYITIVECIQRNLITLSKNDFTEKKFINMDILEPFLRHIFHNYQNVDFITLNYDMILERCLYEVFKRLSSYNPRLDEFYQYPIAEISQRDGNPYIRNENPFQKIPAIIKLHGSANWFWQGKTQSDIIYYSQWQDSENQRRLLSDLIPYIIPPILDKTSFYNHNAITALWTKASSLLKQADEIYIIGFSFPVSDLSVRYLFQTSLRKETKVFVINADTENNLRKTYDPIFGKEMSVNFDFSGKDIADYSVIEHFMQKLLQGVSNE